MGYRINGVALTSGTGRTRAGSGNGAAPSNHDITYTATTLQETLGGTIVLEPPSGLKRVHVWYYDSRTAYTVQFLKNLIGTSGVCTIDTYGIGKEEDAATALYRNLKVSVQMPVWKPLEGDRGMVEPYSLQFTELFPQS